jgi:hypothetical protein
LSKAPILISFQLGRNFFKFDATSSVGTQRMVDAFAEIGSEFVRQETKLNILATSKRLKQVVETAYTDAVRYAVRNMMGRSSPRAWGDPAPFINIMANDEGLGSVLGTRRSDGRALLAKWYPLSHRQIKSQAGGSRGKTGKFFEDTGQLKSELLSSARAMVKKTGAVRIEIKDAAGATRKVKASDKIIPVANLKLKLLPNIYPTQIPGLISGRPYDTNESMGFERSLGLSEEAIRKLKGPVIPGQDDLYHRPLLQPVFTYWSLFRIPVILQEALNRGIVGKNKSSRSGVADYSGG